MGRRSTGGSGVTVTAEQIRDAVGDALKPQYVHHQLAPSAVWTVPHQMGKFPSVTVVDSAGTRVFGDVSYVSPDLLTVTFSAPFGGVAYLN